MLLRELVFSEIFVAEIFTQVPVFVRAIPRVGFRVAVNETPFSIIRNLAENNGMTAIPMAKTD
ncbi:MAG: hypothetical protein Pars92KO_32620 [Parasphingorhabdus sp.]